MPQDLKPSSDWNGWMPSDMHEKYTNVDQLSDIPTIIGSDQDTADFMSALAEADRQP